MLLVKEAMTSEVVTVGPDTTVGEAGRLMLERKVGSIVVTDPERRVLGILTESDFVRGVVGPRPPAR
jgi:CBS domain-containing protein